MRNFLNKYGVALAIPFLFILSFLTGFIYPGENPGLLLKGTLGILFILLLLLAAALAAFYKKNKSLSYGLLLLFILMAAFVLKTEYILYTPTWVRQHDVVGAGAGFGQAAFIEYFCEKLRLIDFDPRKIWGFFQPPLHHMTAGLYLRLWTHIQGISYGQCFEALQGLTLFYSLMTGLVSYLFFRENGYRGKLLLMGAAFMLLNPCFIQMAGSINNDILCILLQLLAMYFFYRWMSSEELLQLCLSALFLGLSMMAKLSAIMLAPPMGLILLYHLYLRIKNKGKLLPLLAEYMLFGLISVPLGIWSPVRNYLRFGVPLNYTPEVGESLAEYSLIERFFRLGEELSPFIRLKSSGASYDEFNILFSILKTGIFGEADFSAAFMGTFFGWIAVLSGAVLVILCLIAMLYSLKGVYGLRGEQLCFLNVYILFSVFFLLRLCISIPNFSSQDFRYIAHILLPAALLLLEFSKSSKWAAALVYAAGGIFIISSAWVYLFAGGLVWK